MPIFFSTTYSCGLPSSSILIHSQSQSVSQSVDASSQFITCGAYATVVVVVVAVPR